MARGICAPSNQVRSNSMKEIAKKIYRKIPVCLRWILWPAKLMFKFVDICRLDLWIISGEEITSHRTLSIIYAGAKINRNYFIKIAYNSSFSENYLGKVWLWKVFKVVKEKGHTCSLMVVAVDKPFCALFRNRECFHIPFWVSSLADISGASSFLAGNRSIKSDVTKITNNKLSFEITQNRSQFDNFYYNMYRPYVSQRHGDGAIISEYDYVRNQFKDNELLLIKKEDEYVAGALLVYEKERFGPVYMGVKDGNFDYVTDGAVGAIFYFAIHRFKEKGYKQVDFGGSRAFLKDGVLRYKKMKGALQISCASRHGGIFFVEPSTNTPGLKAFLINNPFIFIDKGKIYGAVFVGSDYSFSRQTLKKMYKNYYFDGMSRLFIYQFGGDSHKIEKILPLEFSEKIRFRSAVQLFQKLDGERPNQEAACTLTKTKNYRIRGRD